MAILADEFASWLFGLLADVAGNRLVKFLRGDDFDRALQGAAAAAVERTARELRPEDTDLAEQLASVINQVFSEAMPRAPMAQYAPLLLAMRTGIAGQVAILDDADITGTGISSAELIDVSTDALTELLTSHLTQQIRSRGLRGGPLAALADQLNHDIDQLQGMRLEQMIDRLLRAIARIEGAMNVAAPETGHSLPARPASFTDRESELEKLMQAAPSAGGSGGSVRIAVVDGMAGVGKTALAVQAAHQVARDYPDGQIFVRLREHAAGQRPVDPADELVALLLEDGVPPKQIPDGLEARERVWRSRLAGRRILLVLDDATGSEQIRPFLPGSTEALVLITSRHRLTALYGAQPVTLDILPAEVAAQLFVRFAERPGLMMSEDAVAQIVERCGYLPLAIALIAGQLKHHTAWTAEYLANELQTTTDRLAPLHAESLSVAAAFDLSYRHLSSQQQRLFRRLGLHPGTDIDVYAASSLNETDVDISRQLLDDLYSYHLINEPSCGRYSMHDLVREYTRALVGADDDAERDAVQRLLLDYFANSSFRAGGFLARRTATWLPDLSHGSVQSPDISDWGQALAWMNAERLNLQSLTDYAASHDQHKYVIAMAASMHGFLRFTGHWDQALGLQRTALESARRMGNRFAEADVLTNLGDMQYTTGDSAAAKVSLSKALDIYRDIRQKLGEANALKELGVVQRMTGDYRAAGASQALAMEIYDEANDQLGKANVLYELGIVRYLTDRLHEALANLTEALELYADLDNRLGEANALNSLCAVQVAAADYPAATSSITRALGVHREIGGRLGEANALKELGGVQFLTDHYSDAIGSLRESLEIYRSLRNRVGEANALSYLGAAQLAVGDYTAAGDSLHQALGLYGDDRLGVANVLTDLGDLQESTGDYGTAIASQIRARDLYQALPNQNGEANALSHLGSAQTAVGNYPEAFASLIASLMLFSELRDSPGKAATLTNLGDLLLATSTPAIARSMYESSLAITTAIGSPFEQARALEGVGRTHVGDGQLDEGVTLLTQALAIYDRIKSARYLQLDDYMRDHDLLRDESEPS